MRKIIIVAIMVIAIFMSEPVFAGTDPITTTTYPIYSGSEKINAVIEGRFDYYDDCAEGSDTLVGGSNTVIEGEEIAVAPSGYLKVYPDVPGVEKIKRLAVSWDNKIFYEGVFEERAGWAVKLPVDDMPLGSKIIILKCLHGDNLTVFKAIFTFKWGADGKVAKGTYLMVKEIPPEFKPYWKKLSRASKLAFLTGFSSGELKCKEPEAVRTEITKIQETESLKNTGTVRIIGTPGESVEYIIANKPYTLTYIFSFKVNQPIPTSSAVIPQSGELILTKLEPGAQIGARYSRYNVENYSSTVAEKGIVKFLYLKKYGTLIISTAKPRKVIIQAIDGQGNTQNLERFVKASYRFKVLENTTIVASANGQAIRRTIVGDATEKIFFGR